MDLQAPSLVAGLNISVTVTATSLFNLINTAAAASFTAATFEALNGFDITPEDGDVRVSFHPALVPTATAGRLLKSGVAYYFRWKDLDNVQLISTTGTVKCSIAVGTCRNEEIDTASGGSSNVNLTASDIEIGAIEIKNGIDDTRATVTNANTARTTGTTVLSTQPIDAAGNVPKYTGAVTPSAILAGREDTLPWGVYNATPTVRTEGQGGPIQTNTNGDTKTVNTELAQAFDQELRCIKTPAYASQSATYSPTEFKNLGANTVLNMIATAAQLLSITATNANAAVRYLMVSKTATVPAGAAVPAIIALPIPPISNGVPGVAAWSAADLSERGINSTVGWAFAISTTPNSFTDSATAADHTVQAFLRT